MERKEVYATTGSRMIVRLFGGWDFVAGDARLPAEVGYTKGVPMGGDLAAASGGKSPNFLVAAAKDPYSGNLDRTQIVKGWLDAAGQTQEKVYEACGPATAPRDPMASCRRSVTPSMWPARPGPTPSGRRS